MLMLREIVAKLGRVASDASFFCLNQKVSPILPLYQPTIPSPSVSLYHLATNDHPNTHSCYHINRGLPHPNLATIPGPSVLTVEHEKPSQKLQRETKIPDQSRKLGDKLKYAFCVKT